MFVNVRFQLKMVVLACRCACMEFTSVEDAIEALKTVNKAENEARSVTQCHTVFSQIKKMEGERWSSSSYF